MESALTLLEYALVGLTAQEPLSGYDLKKIFETTEMRQFSSSPGSIYPALRRLEKRAFLTSSEEATGDRTRRLYRPTEAGKEALRAWLLAPVTLEELHDDGRTPILRFAFLGSIGAGRKPTRAFLESYREALGRYLEDLRELAEQLGEHPDARPRLAILHGIEQVKGQRRWIDLAEEELGLAQTSMMKEGSE